MAPVSVLQSTLALLGHFSPNSPPVIDDLFYTIISRHRSRFPWFIALSWSCLFISCV